MLSTLLCSIALLLPSHTAPLPAPAPAPAASASSVVMPAPAILNDAASYLTVEERTLLASNPEMLAIGGMSDGEEEVLLYLGVGAVCVGALVLLFALGA